MFRPYYEENLHFFGKIGGWHLFAEAPRAARAIPEISIRIQPIAVRIPIIVTPVCRFFVGVACVLVDARSAD